MALKILTSLKKEISVKEMIHYRLAGWEEPRSHHTLHASDLMKDLEFCPREFAFLDNGLAKKKHQFIGTSLRLTFDHGKEVEYNIRNSYLRDVVSGWWKCNVCGHRHPTFGKEPKVKCQKCGWGNWVYDEVRFVSPISGISGSLDILLDVKQAKLRIVEVKTMDKDEFKSLKAPLAEHKFRTSLYLRLAEESDHSISERVNISEAHILYVSKSYGFKDESLKAAGIADASFSPFKEFTVKRDDSLTDTAVEKAKALKAVRDNPSLGMPCGVCINGLTKRAQKCSAVSSCFSGASPSNITWLENGKPKHPGKKVIG